MYLVKPHELKIVLTEIDKVLSVKTPIKKFGRRNLVSLIAKRCENKLDKEFPYTALLVLPLKEWSKFSGNVHYPVPSVNDMSPIEAHIDAERSDHPKTWDKNDQYGSLIHESNLFVRDYIDSLVQNNKTILIKDNSFKKVNPSQEEIAGDYLSVTKELDFL